MRFLADEDVPGPVVTGLQARGHDVLRVVDLMRGAKDKPILARARLDGRIVLTCDKGFGEIAFHSKLPAECGIVLFRLSGVSPTIDNARALAALESRTDWPGHFAVVADTRIRIRPLPPPGPAEAPRA